MTGAVGVAVPAGDRVQAGQHGAGQRGGGGADPGVQPRDGLAGAAAHLRAAEARPDLAVYRHFGVDLLRAKAVAAERDGRPGEAVAFLLAAVARSDTGGPTELHWRADLVRCALAAAARC